MNKLPYKVKKEPLIIQEDIEALADVSVGLGAVAALLIFLL